MQKLVSVQHFAKLSLCPAFYHMQSKPIIQCFGDLHFSTIHSYTVEEYKRKKDLDFYFSSIGKNS